MHSWRPVKDDFLREQDMPAHVVNLKKSQECGVILDAFSGKEFLLRKVFQMQII